MFELGHQGFFCVWCICLEAVRARHEFIETARLLVQPCGTQDAASPRVYLCTSRKNIQEFLDQDHKLYFTNQIVEPGATKRQLDNDVSSNPDFRH